MIENVEGIPSNVTDRTVKSLQNSERNAYEGSLSALDISKNSHCVIRLTRVTGQNRRKRGWQSGKRNNKPSDECAIAGTTLMDESLFDSVSAVEDTVFTMGESVRSE